MFGDKLGLERIEGGEGVSGETLIRRFAPPPVKMLWGLAAARLVILKVVQHLSRSIQ